MHHGVISGLYMYLNKPNLGLNIEDLANANRDESGRNSSAFIYSRQCYGPGPVWGTN